MRNVVVTLVAEGPTDRRLVDVLEWILAQEVGLTSSVTFADFALVRGWSGTLAQRIAWAQDNFPADVYCIHRDADSDGTDARVAEISVAVREAGNPNLPHVTLIPVRKQEAWFLFDERAIRAAAGWPNGREPLTLPRLSNVERMADPKSALFEALRLASGQSGRRRRQFDVNQAAYRVPKHIDDFSPLRALATFGNFEERLRLAARVHSR